MTEHPTWTSVPASNETHFFRYRNAIGRRGVSREEQLSISSTNLVSTGPLRAEAHRQDHLLSSQAATWSGSRLPIMPMPLVVRLFVVGDRFASTLMLVNNSTAETYADITFRGLDGRTLTTKKVEFAHHSQRLVDVSSLLQSKGFGAQRGSIVVEQSSSLAGLSIGAILAMTYHGASDSTFIDEEISMPSEEGSQVLQGVTDGAGGSPRVARSPARRRAFNASRSSASPKIGQVPRTTSILPQVRHSLRMRVPEPM